MLSRNPRAFTLIELLVVISIVSVLIVLLLPVVQQASDDARKSHHKNALKQFGMGLQNYHDSAKFFPAVVTKPQSAESLYPNSLNTAGWALPLPN